MNFRKYKRWLSVGAMVLACMVIPQTVKADNRIEADGVMGQSIADEMYVDPAEDYAMLSANADTSSAPVMDELPMFRATSYTNLFLESSFKTVSDLNGSTYYHDNKYADCEMINGIDVSWWQGGGRGSKTSKINWKKMHDAGTDFVFVRAASRDTSDASIYEDTTASAHISGAKANKMNVGLYVFSQAINEKEGAEEADYVLDLIDKYGWDIDMPIFIDREAGRQTKRLTDAKLSKAKETAIVQAFSDEITSAGYKAGVYASYYWYNTKMNADKLKNCTIWLARYNNTTTFNTQQVKKKDAKGNYVKDAKGNYIMVDPIPYKDVLCNYEFWQYSYTKPLASTGYTGNLDKSFWYKDTNVKTENLKVDKKTVDSITLTWSDAGDAEQYRVYRYNNETGKYVNLGTISDTTYTDKNLQAGSEYKYKVRCMWIIGGTKYYGIYSAEVNATTLPGKVENVIVSGQSSKKISLSWDAANGAGGYRILQYNSDSGNYEEIASVSADTTRFDVTNLASASAYRFRVQAYKNVDTQTILGEVSDETEGVTKPGKVSALTVKTLGSDVLELSWENIARADGYQIYKRNESSGKYVKLATVEGSENLTYTDGALAAAGEYSYKVRAYKTYNGTDLYGGFSTIVTQTTKPEKVKGVKLTTKSSAVTIKWNKAEGVSGYQIYRLNTKTNKYEKIATVKSADKTSYTNRKLKKGSRYSYKIRAYKRYEGATYYGSYSTVTAIKAK